MTDSELFVDRLLGLVPELKTRFEQHVADNEVLLPHVFMGDVTRFVIDEAKNPNMRETLERFLRAIENELHFENANTKELIQASFVENLMGEEITVEKLKPLMGPIVRKAVSTICGY